MKRRIDRAKASATVAQVKSRKRNYHEEDKESQLTEARSRKRTRRGQESSIEPLDIPYLDQHTVAGYTDVDGAYDFPSQIIPDNVTQNMGRKRNYHEEDEESELMKAPSRKRTRRGQEPNSEPLDLQYLDQPASAGYVNIDHTSDFPNDLFLDNTQHLTEENLRAFNRSNEASRVDNTIIRPQPKKRAQHPAERRAAARPQHYGAAGAPKGLLFATAEPFPVDKMAGEDDGRQGTNYRDVENYINIDPAPPVQPIFQHQERTVDPRTRHGQGYSTKRAIETVTDDEEERRPSKRQRQCDLEPDYLYLDKGARASTPMTRRDDQLASDLDINPNARAGRGSTKSKTKMQFPRAVYEAFRPRDTAQWERVDRGSTKPRRKTQFPKAVFDAFRPRETVQQTSPIPQPPPAPTSVAPNQILDARKVKPSNMWECMSLTQALDYTRDAFAEWTGKHAPFTDPSESYDNQYQTILAEFQEWWYSDQNTDSIHPMPWLVSLGPWSGSLTAWKAPTKSAAYYESLRRGLYARRHPDGTLVEPDFRWNVEDYCWKWS